VGTSQVAPELRLSSAGPGIESGLIDPAERSTRIGHLYTQVIASRGTRPTGCIASSHNVRVTGNTLADAGVVSGRGAITVHILIAGSRT
jgi:hypothetical protein